MASPARLPGVTVSPTHRAPEGYGPRGGRGRGVATQRPNGCLRAAHAPKRAARRWPSTSRTQSGHTRNAQTVRRGGPAT
eukprot:6208416-Pleurochrysis_carterae.AAC.1